MSCRPNRLNVEQSQSGSETTEAPAARPAQRILIGSQRGGDTQTEAKAKPMTPAAPPASSEAEKPKPKKQPPTHYPPPNIRDQLSPELEAEYQAALGDLSFDSLMSDGGDADTADELAAETRVTGRVAKISREDVFIDLGGRNQGVVPLRQFDDAADGRRIARAGRRAVRRGRRPLRTFAADRRRRRRQLGRSQRRPDHRSQHHRRQQGRPGMPGGRHPRLHSDGAGLDLIAWRTRKNSSASGWRAS